MMIRECMIPRRFKLVSDFSMDGEISTARHDLESSSIHRVLQVEKEGRCSLGP